MSEKVENTFADVQTVRYTVENNSNGKNTWREDGTGHILAGVEDARVPDAMPRDPMIVQRCRSLQWAHRGRRVRWHRAVGFNNPAVTSATLVMPRAGI